MNQNSKSLIVEEKEEITRWKLHGGALRLHHELPGGCSRALTDGFPSL